MYGIFLSYESDNEGIYISHFQFSKRFFEYKHVVNLIINRGLIISQNNLWNNNITQRYFFSKIFILMKSKQSNFKLCLIFIFEEFHIISLKLVQAQQQNLLDFRIEFSNFFAALPTEWKSFSVKLKASISICNESSQFYLSTNSPIEIGIKPIQIPTKNMRDGDLKKPDSLYLTKSPRKPF